MANLVHNGQTAHTDMGGTAAKNLVRSTAQTEDQALTELVRLCYDSSDEGPGGPLQKYYVKAWARENPASTWGWPSIPIVPEPAEPPGLPSLPTALWEAILCLCPVVPHINLGHTCRALSTLTATHANNEAYWFGECSRAHVVSYVRAEFVGSGEWWNSLHAAALARLVVGLWPKHAAMTTETSRATREEYDDLFAGEYEADRYEYHCDLVVNVGSQTSRSLVLDKRFGGARQHTTQLGSVGALGRMLIDPDALRMQVQEKVMTWRCYAIKHGVTAMQVAKARFNPAKSMLRDDPQLHTFAYF